MPTITTTAHASIARSIIILKLFADRLVTSPREAQQVRIVLRGLPDDTAMKMRGALVICAPSLVGRVEMACESNRYRGHERVFPKEHSMEVRELIR